MVDGKGVQPNGGSQTQPSSQPKPPQVKPPPPKPIQRQLPSKDTIVIRNKITGEVRTVPRIQGGRSPPIAKDQAKEFFRKEDRQLAKGLKQAEAAIVRSIEQKQIAKLTPTQKTLLEKGLRSARGEQVRFESELEAKKAIQLQQETRKFSEAELSKLRQEGIVPRIAPSFADSREKDVQRALQAGVSRKQILKGFTDVIPSQRTFEKINREEALIRRFLKGGKFTSEADRAEAQALALKKIRKQEGSMGATRVSKFIPVSEKLVEGFQKKFGKARGLRKAVQFATGLRRKGFDVRPVIRRKKRAELKQIEVKLAKLTKVTTVKDDVSKAKNFFDLAKETQQSVRKTLTGTIEKGIEKVFQKKEKDRFIAKLNKDVGRELTKSFNPVSIGFFLGDALISGAILTGKAALFSKLNQREKETFKTNLKTALKNIPPATRRALSNTKQDFIKGFRKGDTEAIGRSVQKLLLIYFAVKGVASLLKNTKNIKQFRTDFKKKTGFSKAPSQVKLNKIVKKEFGKTFTRRPTQAKINRVIKGIKDPVQKKRTRFAIEATTRGKGKAPIIVERLVGVEKVKVVKTKGIREVGREVSVKVSKKSVEFVKKGQTVKPQKVVEGNFNQLREIIGKDQLNKLQVLRFGEKGKVRLFFDAKGNIRDIKVINKFSKKVPNVRDISRVGQLQIRKNTIRKISLRNIKQSLKTPERRRIEKFVARPAELIKTKKGAVLTKVRPQSALKKFKTANKRLNKAIDELVEINLKKLDTGRLSKVRKAPIKDKLRLFNRFEKESKSLANKEVILQKEIARLNTRKKLLVLDIKKENIFVLGPKGNINIVKKASRTKILQKQRQGIPLKELERKIIRSSQGESNKLSKDFLARQNSRLEQQAQLLRKIKDRGEITKPQQFVQVGKKSKQLVVRKEVVKKLKKNKVKELPVISAQSVPRIKDLVPVEAVVFVGGIRTAVIPDQKLEQIPAVEIGQRQVLIVKDKSITKPKVEALLVTKPKGRTELMPVLKVSSKKESKPILKQIINVEQDSAAKQKLKQIPQQKQKIIQKLKTDVAQQLKQATKTGQKLSQKQISRFKKLLITTPSGQKADLIKKIAERNQAFNAFIKKKLVKSGAKRISAGFRKINKVKLTESAARGMAFKVLDEFANRSGFVKRTTGSPVPRPRLEKAEQALRNRFRLSKKALGIFVEKSKFAISSKKEKQDIPFEGLKVIQRNKFLNKISKSKRSR